MTSRASKLKNVVAYLSGSMEYCPEGGVGWRKVFKDSLIEKEIPLVCIDPTDKPRGLMDEGDGLYHKLRNSHDWVGLKKYVHQIRRDDLRCVDLCDFVVVCIDRKIHACGTYDEVFTAEDQHKPILCIAVGGKENLPGWLFDVLELEEIFDSVEECVDYIDRLNKGEIELDPRWVLIRDHLNNKELQHA